MAETAKTAANKPANSSGHSATASAVMPGGPLQTASGSVRMPPKKMFKYPSEDETFVRRLGSAVLGVWPMLEPEIQQKILAEANLVWDREYNVGKLPQKLEAFVKRHPGRLS